MPARQPSAETGCEQSQQSGPPYSIASVGGTERKNPDLRGPGFHKSCKDWSASWSKPTTSPILWKHKFTTTRDHLERNGREHRARYRRTYWTRREQAEEQDDDAKRTLLQV
jgi:hypothetical protein